MKRHLIAVAAVALGVLVVPAAHAQQTAEELYQAGLYQEEVQGNLERAIDIYRGILEDFSGSRAVGARAQLHIGLCYEKLGRIQAQQAYRRVIDEFPEHPDEVAVARDRLASLERALAERNRQPTFRKIEIASKPENGVLSPDGSQLAFISDGAVWVVPLHGKVDPDIAGEPVRLAEVPGLWDNGSLLAWSANGQWIAVNGLAEGEDAVYVLPAAGGEPKVVRVPDRGGLAFSYRLSLSPDGQTIAISALELGTRQEAPSGWDRYIYTIPTAGGEPRQVSSGWGRLPAFSPDGQLIAYVGDREREDWPENRGRSRFDSDLWVAPSSGGTPVKLASVDGGLRGPVWSPDRKYIAAHHRPGRTDHSREIWVYPLSADASSVGVPVKIPLPRSSLNMLAGWSSDGELGVFLQAEQHDAIYTVPASGGKAVQITRDGEWPSYPNWSPDGERIYYRKFDEKEQRVSTVFVPATGGDPVDVPVRSERWLVSREPGGGLNVSPDGKWIVVSAYQEPYDPDEGVDVWTIPLAGGRPIRLTNDGSFEGYPCWSPDGRWVAFVDWHKTPDGPTVPIHYREGEGFDAIYVVPAGGGEIRRITSQADSVSEGPIAFSPDGERIAFFSGGTIKTIPVAGGRSEVLVAEVKSTRHGQLAYSPDGSRITHNADGKIWITRLDGGAPEELSTGLPEDAELGEFGWSPDGERIAFLAMLGGDPEFWLISDFLPSNRDR